MNTKQDVESPTPYFYIGDDCSLMVVVPTDDLHVCQHCPDLHVRILSDATPTNMRVLAVALVNWAKWMEQINVR